MRMKIAFFIDDGADEGGYSHPPITSPGSRRYFSLAGIRNFGSESLTCAKGGRPSRPPSSSFPLPWNGPAFRLLPLRYYFLFAPKPPECHGAVAEVGVELTASTGHGSRSLEAVRRRRPPGCHGPQPVGRGRFRSTLQEFPQPMAEWRIRRRKCVTRGPCSPNPPGPACRETSGIHAPGSFAALHRTIGNLLICFPVTVFHALANVARRRSTRSTASIRADEVAGAVAERSPAPARPHDFHRPGWRPRRRYRLVRAEYTPGSVALVRPPNDKVADGGR